MVRTVRQALAILRSRGVVRLGERGESRKCRLGGRDSRESSDERQILGVNFYVGEADGVFSRMARGGLLVVPAAPALKDVAQKMLLIMRNIGTPLQMPIWL